MYTYIYTQTPYIYINTFKHHSSHSRGYQKALLGITGNNTRFHHVMIGILLFLYSALFLCLFSLFMLLSEFFNFIILLGCFLAGFFFSPFTRGYQPTGNTNIPEQVRHEHHPTEERQVYILRKHQPLLKQDEHYLHPTQTPYQRKFQVLPHIT